MSRKLLITGGRGFVAGSVIAQADLDTWEVHAISRGPAPGKRRGLVWHQADPLDPAAFGEVMNRVRPEAILHCGANPNIDYCEQNPGDAVRTNVEWTKRVVALAETYEARLVYTSTDNIFDGEAGPYREDAVPEPVNFYGQTKLMGEHAVRAGEAPSVIARVAVVMGMPMFAPGENSTTRMRAALKRGETVFGAEDEIRTPVDVVTLGAALLELCGSDWMGTIHLAGGEPVSRYAFMRKLAAAWGYPEERVEVGLPAPGPQRAPRPRDCSLATQRAKELLKTPILGPDETAAAIAAQAGAVAT